MDNKIVSINEFNTIREKLRLKGKKVVHCHGVFDLVHPGHIIHLQEAKSVGDALIVSITDAKYVQKGLGRPYFSNELRMRTIAALECVDYVVLSEYTTAIEIIDKIKPDVYVKGAEYSNYEEDVTQNIEAEIDRVRLYGGDVYFTKGEVFSSTKLINNNFGAIPEDVKGLLKEFSGTYKFEYIRNIIEKMKDIKVLVIGDIIIDEYVFCEAQGLMSKDRGLSTKYIREESYLGGSLAIARHISQFSDDVTVMGIAGDESDIHSKILSELGKSMKLDLQFDKKFSTIRKRKYMEKRGQRDEYDKLFSINFIEDANFEGEIESRIVFWDKLTNEIAKYDLVVVADYGHGLLDQKAMDIIQDNAKFLALNCQTNSSNHGRNLITKYRRADIFTLDEREISLAFFKDIKHCESSIDELRIHLNSRSGWLTVGSKGAVGIDTQDKKYKCPALTLNIKDTVGAGDAFFAVVALSGYLETPVEVGTFLGNVGGALATNILGNSGPIEKVKLLKYISTLLNI